VCTHPSSVNNISVKSSFPFNGKKESLTKEQFERFKFKILQFKKIVDDKTINEVKNNHSQQTSQLSIEFKEELDRYNEEWDKQFAILNQKYEKMREEVNFNHRKELDEKVRNFEETYPKPKGSRELLNLHTVLDNLVKQKDYKNAHSTQIQILNMQKSEDEKWLKTKQEKLEKEISKIASKQENENKVFENKMDVTFTEFKKTRALETERIILKYTNKSKELEKVQKTEMSETKKPGHGKIDTLLRPSSKVAYKNIAISSSEHNKSSFQK